MEEMTCNPRSLRTSSRHAPCPVCKNPKPGQDNGEQAKPEEVALATSITDGLGRPGLDPSNHIAKLEVWGWAAKNVCANSFPTERAGSVDRVSVTRPLFCWGNRGFEVAVDSGTLPRIEGSGCAWLSCSIDVVFEAELRHRAGRREGGKTKP